jgi:hypothetical protein
MKAKKPKFLAVVNLDLKEILAMRRTAKQLQQDIKDAERLDKLEKELNKKNE